ncbi:protein-L-isoaspartate(D-aspartate) O-methyltransferase [Magnetospirillum molischianum]|uniref:Protein-L-isoaspartate O-methyltransferase n=1 Tax=Magnetospirillum molischianum DSM 120 TaxID=1150626 RepID=H8FRS7_MAGML|nr:protein-L-isoaspartate(D-aspartate) O-methyltransferase [Magnetospirillum molischianum]CCG41065.1 Protein-L-isoaspartate O-methyltransferase (Protein-beta-aspartate methyltransferase) (PIMT) (Protein L-isoaspartyl methyltransferase) (L-isoaspartyl protein carboxyl methyltransferase) [Magnetospirillum molischianum DSM 120]
MSPAESRVHRLLAELRRHGVGDARVLAAIGRVPRHHFIAPPFLDQAYENVALPIGRGQTVSQPMVVGLMTQALAVGERMKVLEIGTGSGYQAAVLAPLCRRLYSVERHRPLLSEAEARLRHLRIHNVTCRLGDGSRGWPEQAPFDRIIVTAAAPDVPPALLEQLKPDGLMVLPLGDVGGIDQELVLIAKTPEGLDIRPFLAVRFVPLVEGLPEE